MKKIYYIVVFVFYLIAINVHADNIYYESGKYKLTEREYNYILEFYGEKYLSYMTEEQYSWIKELDIDNNEYEIKKSNMNENVTRGTYATSNQKTVSISKVCNANYCAVTLLTTFLSQPSVKSYDVVGARFMNTSLYNSYITTIVSSSSGSTVQSNYMNYYNGFGNSIQLPSSGTIYSVEQNYKVNKTGIVYGSYQHATSNISLANSKLYTISSSGYGNVFGFYGNAYGIYDNTTGVYI